jgi:molecular chaperone GrpE
MSTQDNKIPNAAPPPSAGAPAAAADPPAPADPSSGEVVNLAGEPISADQLMQAASKRIAELEAELADMRDRWMRAEAETQNVRNRARREVEETRQFAVQAFARDVVEAAENLKRGLDSIPPPTPGEPEIVSRLRDGFAGVERSFMSLLERNGIRRQDPVGALFDPNLHQAMAEQESVEHPPGTVLQAWSGAWTLNGRLLRPAMVVVAKAPPAELPSAARDAAGQKLNTTA